MRSETDVSQPSGFISYFHNDISLVTEGQQARREQRGPVMRPPPWGRLGVGEDMSSRDGRGHRGSDHGVRPAASQSESSWRQHIYGLFWSLFTEEPGRGPDVDPLEAGREVVRGSGPLCWTTLDKCRLMMEAPSFSELHDSKRWFCSASRHIGAENNTAMTVIKYVLFIEFRQQCCCNSRGAKTKWDNYILG